MSRQRIRAEGRRDCAAVKLLSSQFVVTQAKAFHLRGGGIAVGLVNASQQYGGKSVVGNGKILAKTGPIRDCSSTGSK
jgi:hypothetical protein